MDPFRAIIGLPFAAASIGAILQLLKGLWTGRFAKRWGFRKLTDSDLDWAYRDREFGSFVRIAGLQVLGAILAGYGAYILFAH